MALSLLLAACSGGSDELVGDGGRSGAASSNDVSPGAGVIDAGARSGDAADGGPAPAGARKGSGGSGGALGASVAVVGCAACRVHTPPGYAPGKAAPLLVALHGDEGPLAGVPSVLSLWSSAADTQGAVVLALACGSELGCASGNWSGWLAAQGYRITTANLGVIAGLVETMESLYDVDVKREYVAGYSGGAYALGYLAQAMASRFAAAAFIAGGMPAWTGTGNACPARKIPGYFLGGDRDPRTGGQMSDTASSFDGCGQEIALDVLAGADHGQTIASLGSGRAATIMTWLAARPLP